MPCGRPWWIVMSYEIEWASAVRVFENARPAVSAASAMRRRSSMSRRFFISAGSVASTSRAAVTAWLSDTGFALTFQIDSSACDSASRPRRQRTARRAATASAPGRRSPPRARSRGRCSEYFLPAARCQTVAQPRHLAAGARGRRHGDQRLDAVRRERLAGREQRDQRVELAALGADHQRLGGVEGAAAADRDDAPRSPGARARSAR